MGSLFPRCIAQSLLAVSTHPTDPFRDSALALMCKLAVLVPKMCAEIGSIRALAKICTGTINHHLQDSIIVSVLYLLNDAETRCFVSPLDCRLVLAPLTQTYGRFNTRQEIKQAVSIYQNAVRAFVSMLRSWAGLMALYTDTQGMKAVISSLQMQPPYMTTLLLDGLFSVLRLMQPKDGDDPFVHVRKTSPAPVTEMVESNRLDLPSRVKRHNLLDNYIAALLIAFLDCGLVEGLIELVILKPVDAQQNDAVPNIDMERMSRVTSTKAQILLGEILHLSNTLFPHGLRAKLQSLPNLVSQAGSFSNDSSIRSRASSTISNLHQYMHMKETNMSCSSSLDFHTSLLVSGASKWRRMKGKDRRLDRLDDVKMKIDWKMDEKVFFQKVSDTGVLTSKDWEKWNWEAISDLLEGPLNNPTHLTSVLRSGKLNIMKNLLKFLKPSTKAFSVLPRTNPNLKYVRIACQLMEVLLSCDTGKQFLFDNELFAQIGEMLNLETTIGEGTSSGGQRERLFSAERVLRSMAREYFTMIGTLSSSQSGLVLLSKHKIFEYLSPLSVKPGREDLSHLIMTSLDYNLPGASRILLSKSLTATSKVIRFLATRHLKVLLRAGVSGFPNWGIKLLVKQLLDNDRNVNSQALAVLDEACDETDCLESLIGRKPPLNEMGEAGKNLFIRFLSRESGFQALKDSGFIQSELVYWREKGFIEYTQKVEEALQEAFGKSIAHQSSLSSTDTQNGVQLPPHFYGELASTPQGAQTLKDSGHFDEFVKMLIDVDGKVPALHRRSALWAIGQVGKSKSGLPLFSDNLIGKIVDIAHTDSNLSLKGTCFNVIGLLASTETGTHILLKHGWASPNIRDTYVAVPQNAQETTQFFVVPYDSYQASWPINCPSLVLSLTDAKDGDLRKEIIEQLSNLSNHITSEGAVRQLKKLYQLHPDVFCDSELFARTLVLLENYKFRLPFRRFIFGLFRNATLDQAHLDIIGVSNVQATTQSSKQSARKSLVKLPSFRSK